MSRQKNRKGSTKVAMLGGLGFLLGLGAVFLFGTEKGKKYRNQLGEFTADFLDSLAEGCQELKDDLSS